MSDKILDYFHIISFPQVVIFNLMQKIRIIFIINKLINLHFYPLYFIVNEILIRHNPNLYIYSGI